MTAGSPDHDADDLDQQRDAARRRLDINLEMIRALEMADEIAAVVRASKDSAAAARSLMDAPFGFSQMGAHYVLDMVLAKQTQERRQQFFDEVQELRAFLQDGTAPLTRPPSEPTTLEFWPARPPDQFLRLVLGPPDEVEFAHGQVRVIGVEMYESSKVVQWRHVQDPDKERLRSFGSPPRLSDDIGTDYPVAMLPEVASEGDQHFGRLTCFIPPADGATALVVTWGSGNTIAVSLPD